jgi:hypothetical protein
MIPSKSSSWRRWRRRARPVAFKGAAAEKLPAPFQTKVNGLQPVDGD